MDITFMLKDTIRKAAIISIEISYDINSKVNKLFLFGVY